MAVTGEPEQADAVAFVLAHLRGDEPLIEAMFGMFEVRDFFGVVTGLLVMLLGRAGLDETALEATLADWQARRNAAL